MAPVELEELFVVAAMVLLLGACMSQTVLSTFEHTAATDAADPQC